MKCPERSEPLGLISQGVFSLYLCGFSSFNFQYGNRTRKRKNTVLAHVIQIGAYDPMQGVGYVHLSVI